MKITLNLYLVHGNGFYREILSRMMKLVVQIKRWKWWSFVMQTCTSLFYSYMQATKEPMKKLCLFSAKNKLNPKQMMPWKGSFVSPFWLKPTAQMSFCETKVTKTNLVTCYHWRGMNWCICPGRNVFSALEANTLMVLFNKLNFMNHITSTHR